MREVVAGAIDTEESTTTTSEGSAGVSAGVQLSGKALKAKLAAERKLGARHKSQQSEGSEEHTTLNVRDNLLVAFLDDMREQGWLSPFDPTTSRAGLFEITGAMRYFDWSTIQRVLNMWKGMHDALREVSPSASSPMAFSDKAAKTIASFASMIGLEGFHLQMDVGTPIIAPLALEHLTLTREQMMVTYLRDEAIQGTLVAYVNPSSGTKGPSSGLSRHVQFGSILDSFLGDSMRVLPLVVYSPIAGPM